MASWPALTWFATRRSVRDMATKKSSAFRPGTRVRLTGGDNEEAIGLEGTLVEAPARTWDRSAAWRRGGAWVEWDGLADPSWEKLEWLTLIESNNGNGSIRHHAKKKSPAQLQREIDEVLAKSAAASTSKPFVLEEALAEARAKAKPGALEDAVAKARAKTEQSHHRHSIWLTRDGEFRVRPMFEKVSPLWFFIRHVPSEDELRAEHVYTGDNYPDPNERMAWVKMTRHGETVTEEWPNERIRRLR